MLGLLAAVVPIGTLVATAAISTGTRDHRALLRNAAWCGALTAGLAAPLFWLEADGGLAFVAFLIAGGMFAVSIPTNQVIGMRLSRDTRASAMGIAVGVLMGSQAVGAAVGGLAASVVGPAHAIAGALSAATVLGVWAAATTPTEAKHMLRQRRPVRTGERAVVDLAAIDTSQPPAGVVVNLGGPAPVSTTMRPAPRPSRLLLLPAAALVLTVGLAACGDDDDPVSAGGDDTTTTAAAPAGDGYGTPGGGDTGGEAGESVVVAKDFSLTDLTVAPGAEFTLDNQGEAPHTLTADDGEFDSGSVAAGSQSDPLTSPDEAGEYGFHCEIHDGMKATLTVEG